jgi:hypothetical protein
MWRTAASLALAMVVSATGEGTARAQALPEACALTAPAAHATPADSPFHTTNRVLRASLERIANKSTLWRAAADAVRAQGRRVLVLTPDQVMVKDREDDEEAEAFDSSALAEVSPIVCREAHVHTVLVVVNLPLIKNVHDTRWSVPLDVEADLDRVLVHEIYGHAVPYLLAGNLSGRCADPKKGERATDACAIRRENAVRAELGLGRRTDSGLYSLALSRRGR